MVGLAFQNLPGMDNIGYVIPTPIIHRFLQDIAADAAARRKRRRASRESASGIRKMIERGIDGTGTGTGTGTGSDGGGGGGGGGDGGVDSQTLGHSDAPVYGTNDTLDHGGFCTLGVKCQAMDNPALRSYFGMLPHETGVLVTSVLKVRRDCLLWHPRNRALTAFLSATSPPFFFSSFYCEAFCDKTLLA